MNHFGPPRRRGRALVSHAPVIEEPIAAELFSVERLEHYAGTLAATQEVASGTQAGVSLHGRLRANAAALDAAHAKLLAETRTTRATAPAAAWLLDNYFVVDEHVQAVRRDLPPGFYRQLPKLAGGALRGHPRIYGLAWALVAHTDSRFDLETLQRFCRAYQRVQPLTIGELWAIAITLRVILIENLRRLADGMVYRQSLRENADMLADELLEGYGGEAAPNLTGLRKLEGGQLPNAFTAQLFQRLRDHDPARTPALPWLHGRLALQGTTCDEVVHVEHQRQGAVNVSVRNVITSLRMISSVDWPKFVESVSLVDELLRNESNFAALDFSSRDLYRHAVEDLAAGCRRPQLEVVRRALDLAKRAAPAAAFCRTTTVTEGGRTLGLTHNLGGAPGECVSFVGVVGTEPSD